MSDHFVQGVVIATIACATYHLELFSFVSVIDMLQQALTGEVLCAARRTGEGVSVRANPAAHTYMATGDTPPFIMCMVLQGLSLWASSITA